MIVGQSADLYFSEQNQEVSEEDLLYIHEHKTGKLLLAPVSIASILKNNKNYLEWERFGKLLGLLFQMTDDILDVTGEFGKLGKSIGKGNKERIIYLNHAAQEAVKSYMRFRLDPRFIRTSDKAFFLSTRQQRISPKTVQWMVKKYLEMSGLSAKGYSVHKLRHTAATLMYQSGKVDIRVLKDVLGHEQLNTTQIYTHLVNKNLEEAVQNNPLADVVFKKPKTYSADE
jgi:integrase